MKKITGVAARTMYALPMAVFGFNHLMYANMMQGIVPAFLPLKVFWVYFTGLALLAAAVSIIINKYAKLASLLLGVLLLTFAFTIHFPGVLNPETMMGSLPSFLKDTSLAGAAFVLSGILKNK
ncbi:MAG TPA: DoxX family protein [bacterium]|nr:DoxX family protein [bacterium]HPN43409.1 DoxX family protein [bacterium]